MKTTKLLMGALVLGTLFYGTSIFANYEPYSPIMWKPVGGPNLAIDFNSKTNEVHVYNVDKNPALLLFKRQCGIRFEYADLMKGPETLTVGVYSNDKEYAPTEITVLKFTYHPLSKGVTLSTTDIKRSSSDSPQNNNV